MDYDANEALARVAAARQRAREMLAQAKRDEAEYERRMRAAEIRAARWTIVGGFVIFIAGLTIYVWAK